MTANDTVTDNIIAGKCLVHFGRCKGACHLISWNRIVGDAYQCRTCPPESRHWLCPSCYADYPFKGEEISVAPPSTTSEALPTHEEELYCKKSLVPPRHCFELVSLANAKDFKATSEIIDAAKVTSEELESQFQKFKEMAFQFERTSVRKLLKHFARAFIRRTLSAFTWKNKLPVKTENTQNSYVAPNVYTVKSTCANDTLSFGNFQLQTMLMGLAYLGFLFYYSASYQSGYGWVGSAYVIYLTFIPALNSFITAMEVATSGDFSGKPSHFLTIVKYQLGFLHKMSTFAIHSCTSHSFRMIRERLKTQQNYFMFDILRRVVPSSTIVSAPDANSKSPITIEVAPASKAAPSCTTENAPSANAETTNSMPSERSHTKQEPKAGVDTVTVAVDPLKVLYQHPSKVPMKRLLLLFNLSFGLTELLAIVSIDHMSLYSYIGSPVGVPQQIVYAIDGRFSPVCSNETSSCSIPRAKLSLKFDPIPSTQTGLPTVTVRMTHRTIGPVPSNSTAEQEHIVFLPEQVWNGMIIDSDDNSTSLTLTAAGANDVIIALVTFPTVAQDKCSELALMNVSVVQQIDKAFDFKSFKPSSSSFQGLVIVLAALMPNAMNLCSTLSEICDTWATWQKFDQITDPSHGLWVPDLGRFEPVDLSRRENLVAWFQLRSTLVQMSQWNMKLIQSCLLVPIFQFVLASAAILWFVFRRSAPFPGFVLAIVLTVLPVPFVSLLEPIIRIWTIQYNHCAFLAQLRLDFQLERRSQGVNGASNEEVPQVNEDTIELAGIYIEKLQMDGHRVSLWGVECSPGVVRSVFTAVFSLLSYVVGAGTIEYYVSNY